MSGKKTLVAIAAVLLAATAGRAEDWPTWRHDVARTASSREQLPPKMVVRWERHLPEPRPMWTDRMNESIRTYEPVVAGKTIFVPSMIAGSVTACDTDTGAERWRFYAGGPVWFAPVAAGGKLWFGSDDGFVYCLDAVKGTLVWKRDLRPRTDRMAIYGSYVSSWPVRVAPSLADGVYVGSGFLDSGQFIWCLDPNTGAVRYRVDKQNLGADRSNGADPFLGGYFRHAPGRLSSSQGKSGLLVFWLDDRSIFMGSIFRDLGTGRRFPTHAESYELNSDSTLLEGVGGNVVVDGATVYSGNNPPRSPKKGKSGIWAFPYEPEKAAEKLSITAIRDEFGDAAPKPAANWKLLDADYRLHCKAGNRLYASPCTFGKVPAEKSKPAAEVLAIDIPQPNDKKPAKPAISWRAKVDGPAECVFAADGKLFVVTGKGTIYCFAEAALPPQPEQPKPNTPVPDGGEWAGKVRDARIAAGSGPCLVLGINSGNLIDALIQETKINLVIIDRVAENIDALRRRMDDAGLLGMGRRVQVLNADLADLRDGAFPLIISEAGLDLGTDAAMGALLSALRPYGGVACLTLADQQKQAAAACLAKPAFAALKLGEAGAFTTITRAGAPDAAIDMTHFPGVDAAESLRAPQDIPPPYRLAWMRDELAVRMTLAAIRSKSKPKTVLSHVDGIPRIVYRGKIIIVQTREEPLSPIAIDAFTGEKLWQSDLVIPELNCDSQGYLAAGGEWVFVGTGKGLHRLSLETGKLDPAFAPFPGKPIRNLRLADQVLVVEVDKAIIGLSPSEGKQLWQYQARPCDRPFRCVVGGGRVFCVEGAVKDAKRPIVTALDLQTGSIAWQRSLEKFELSNFAKRPKKEPWQWLKQNGVNTERLQYAAGPAILLLRLLQQQPDGNIEPEVGKTGAFFYEDLALNAADGSIAWEKQNPIDRNWPWACPFQYYFVFGDQALLRLRKPIDIRTGVEAEKPLPGGFGTCAQQIGFCEFDTYQYLHWPVWSKGCSFPWLSGSGMVLALDGLHGENCQCYSLRSVSLGLVRDERGEFWPRQPLRTPLDQAIAPETGVVKSVGINCGGLGTRKDGPTMWYGWLPENMQPDGRFYQHASWMLGDKPWVTGSGLEGVEALKIKLGDAPERACTVRLHFAEPQDILRAGNVKAGERVFSVALQGQVVLPSLDVLQEAGGHNRGLVKEFKGIRVKDVLTVDLKAAKGKTLLCGVEVVAE